MGILDDVIGKVKGKVTGSGGEQSNLMNEVLGMLSGGEPGGRLQELIQKFQSQGLGDIISSWVSTRQNLPINDEQVKSALGSDLIGQLASKAGLPPDIATKKLTELLPTLVDKLTPEGKVPDSAMLQKGLDLLRSNLPKS